MPLKLYQGTKTTIMPEAQLRFELVRAALRGGAIDATMTSTDITDMLTRLIAFIGHDTRNEPSPP